MHKYFRTADQQIIAIRLTGMPRADFDAAVINLTPVPAPKNAAAQRASGAIRTCRVLSGGRIGSI